jgi:phosphatidylserine synthase
MVSRVPTLSIKHVHIPRRLRPAIVGFVGLLFCSAVLWPWATMTVALIVYLATIPVSAATGFNREFEEDDFEDDD